MKKVVPVESMGVANLQTARQALICIDFHSFLLKTKAVGYSK